MSWTKEPPTEPGWYWLREAADKKPCPREAWRLWPPNDPNELAWWLPGERGMMVMAWPSAESEWWSEPIHPPAPPVSVSPDSGGTQG